VGFPSLVVFSSTPLKVLKAAGLAIAASGAAGAWACTITGTLPSLSEGHKVLKFDAVSTDTLDRSATGSFTITYISNTGPEFTDTKEYTTTLFSGLGTATGDDMPALEATDEQEDAYGALVLGSSSHDQGCCLLALASSFSVTLTPSLFQSAAVYYHITFIVVTAAPVFHYRLKFSVCGHPL
jgi:hypothetical protein